MRTFLRFLAAAALLSASPALASEPKADKAGAKGKAASGKTLLKLEVTPASEIFVDGKSKGKKELLELEVKPGLHIVRFVHPGGDEHENQVDVASKKTTVYQWKFDYDTPPSAEGGEAKPAEPAVVTP